jgi:hypothetical protein
MKDTKRNACSKCINRALMQAALTKIRETCGGGVGKKNFDSLSLMSV